MTDKDFVPALGRSGPTWLYDSVVALLTREKEWRQALLIQLAPTDEDVILDIGCGTGTLAILIKKSAPKATVIGVDPDPDVLKIAKQKAKKAGVKIHFMQGYIQDLQQVVAAYKVTKIVSSLVFHQVTLPEKIAGLQAIRRLLHAGGELHIADYGLQRTNSMRLLFKLVQYADGFERTQPNADGILLDLMQHADFNNPKETQLFQTLTGSISLYQAKVVR